MMLCLLKERKVEQRVIIYMKCDLKEEIDIELTNDEMRVNFICRAAEIDANLEISCKRLD